MIFFKQYKNNDIPKNRKIDKVIKETVSESFSGDLDDAIFDYEKVDELIDSIKNVGNRIKEELLKNNYKADKFFDEDLYKHLDILNNFFSGYISDFPKYYDDDGNINPRVFFDVRDLIKNELNVAPDILINSDNNLGGIYNDNLIHFENGFTVDVNGNVYGPDWKLIFNPKDPNIKIDSMDLVNEKIIVGPVVIEMPDEFIKDYIYENEYVEGSFKKDLEDLKDKIENGETDEKPGTIIGKVDDTYIYDDRFLDFKVDDLYMGDIFPDGVDFLSQIRNYNASTDSFGVCNIKDIPYAELNSLLFWGGGEKGVKPLAATEISNSDIDFKPDGTVYYTGVNSTIRIRRSGCKSKSYKTGHLMMYSQTNRIGLRRSMIQYIYGFCEAVGLFKANIPKLRGFKKFKIFPGLCIGGLLEMAICAWQERLSKRINELFQCVPAEIPTDSSEAGFKNFSFPYGSSVKDIYALDSLKSVQYGDRFIVNRVPTSVTGGTSEACGVFIYDPQKKLASTHPWRYGEFSGKPFAENEPNTVAQKNASYYNPVYEDIIMNTNATGEDSITRRLMALQFAYQKKQELLSAGDVNVALEASVQNITYDMLDRLTNKILDYVTIDDMFDNIESNVPGREPAQCAAEVIRYFKPLIDAGIRKEPILKNYERIYTYTESTSSDTDTVKTAKYYDFSSLNKDEYIVPIRKYISDYDKIMFAMEVASSEDLKDVYKDNLKYMELAGGDSSKYKNVKTIWEFINVSGEKDLFMEDIRDNLEYIKADLEYSEYDENAFEQVSKRCYYVLENKNLLD